jgi:hypothetical protein
MKIEDIPEHVEPMVILGNDNDYLTVYTCLSNEDTIEMLERSVAVLKHEQSLEEESSRHLH